MAAHAAQRQQLFPLANEAEGKAPQAGEILLEVQALLQDAEGFLAEVDAWHAPHMAQQVGGLRVPVGVREQMESQDKELERLRGEAAKLQRQLSEEQGRQTAAHGSPAQKMSIVASCITNGSTLFSAA